jgi:hypothetical protein
MVAENLNNNCMVLSQSKEMQWNVVYRLFITYSMSVRFCLLLIDIRTTEDLQCEPHLRVK